MNKNDSDNFKYDIPENEKYNDGDDYEGEEEVQLEYDDEINWNDVSEESEGEENSSHKKKDDFQNYKNRASFKKSYKKGERKK